jgi:hypothetical protein
MLCQLVCVDRRYQRMNCFNIREIQGILKRKFFTDLVNTGDIRSSLDSTIISMRHRQNMSNILLYDQSLFYNFDLSNNSRYKSFFIQPNNTYLYQSSGFFSTPSVILNTRYNILYRPVMTLNQTLKDLFYFSYIPLFYSICTLHSSIVYIKYLLVSVFFVPSTPLDNIFSGGLTQTSQINQGSDYYISSPHSYSSVINNYKFSLSDNSSSWRFNRYSYPLISYDYKSGNYLGI